MKSFLHIAAIGLLAFFAPTVFAQQPQPSTEKSAQSTQAAPTPEEFDKQLAKMQENMTRMQEQMEKIRQTKDPQARQQLLQQHWTTMQNAMGMMHEMSAGGRMGCCGTGGQASGGHMMGPMMRWGDYRNLTPDQLRQRQYMMDRWMPMQQMMMDQMMQHQHWMMQSQPPAATR